jgi:beta-glucanase (GH16 family)
MSVTTRAEHNVETRTVSVDAGASLGWPVYRLVLVGAAVFALLCALVVLTAGAGGATRLSLSKAPATTTTTTVPFVANTSSVPQTTTSDGRTDCGGVVMDKADGTPWTCTFDDEFDGTTVNTNNWNVVTTATSSYHSGSECYENSPNNVSVSGGTLNLTLMKVKPFFCKEMTGGYSTDYTAGTVESDMHFSQTYGYFEVKAKFPAATVKGLQSSLWLWPVNDDYYGSKWPASGEIDIAEWYSLYPTLAIPYIHYNPAGGSKADPNVTNDYCSVANTNAYNTYAAVWTPTTITILMDGQTCLVDDWNPASPEVKPDPFNMPFFVNLTSAMGITTNAPASNISTDLPATTNIDWVRVWS